jgi:hypothetical protein
MPCALTKAGFNWTAKTGSNPTVKVIADNTTMTGAKYNGQDLTVNNNSTTFTVVDGTALLLLALAGPPEKVEIVEDCGGGQTQHMFGYTDDFHPVIGFTIVSQPAPGAPERKTK